MRRLTEGTQRSERTFCNIRSSREKNKVAKPIRILGIAGSLRRESYNRSALRAATQLAPENTILETFELDGIPIFNQDEEQTRPRLSPSSNDTSARQTPF